MTLTPSGPPGRSARKARAFETEIRELQRQGHTLEAIRQALAAVGVQVSKSTVQREATRQARVRREPPALPAPALPALRGPQPHIANPRGQDVAAAFVGRQITNPLLRARQTSKDPP